MAEISFTDVPYLFEFNGNTYSIDQLQEMYVKAVEPLESKKQQLSEAQEAKTKFCNSIDRSQTCVPYGTKAYECSLTPNDPDIYKKDKQCKSMRENVERLQTSYNDSVNYANSLKQTIDKSILTRELSSQERLRQLIEYEKISSTFKTIEEKPVESSISIASSLIPLGIIALIGLRGKK